MKILVLLQEMRYAMRHPLVKNGVRVMIAGTVIFLGALTLWWSALRTDNAIKIEIAEKNKLLVYIRQSDELVRQYAQNQKMLPSLETKLTQRITQSQLVGMLNNLSRENNVHIISENYEEDQTDSGESIILADIVVQGRYQNTKKFLSGVTALPAWTEMRDVRMESVSGKGTIKSRLRIATFRNT
jgi:Tfp pilus assembly protein PilO